jgi:hypothetical protein
VLRERIPVLAAALVALAVAAPAAHAKPAPLTTVSCGQVITTSIRVANDLSGCQTGLVVGASNITIDLNGHTIAGAGDTPFGAGVLNDQGYDRVTMRNGTVRDFTYGIYGEGASLNVVDRITALDNLVGVGFVESDRITITNSRASGGQIGFNLGFMTTDSRVSRVTTSDVEQGVVLSVLSRNNLVERSDIEAINFGVQVFESSDHTISRNSITGAAIGVLVEGGSTGITVVRNEITDSSSTGISVTEAYDVVLRDNLVTDSAGDGIWVHAPAVDVLLTRNRAYEDGQLGIRADAPVIDGGGNRAARNGDPRQCVGVTCRR